jgi:hypothetical protein
MSCPGQESLLSHFGLQLKTLFSGFVVVLALQPNSLRACAACFGQSDSPMAAGMNWGIFSLLGVVVFVLGSVAAFFIYLARRSAAGAAHPVTKPVLESTGAAWPDRRSAPSLRRSEVRKRWIVGVFQLVGRVRHCCARERAHSGTVAFGGARSVRPGTSDLSL